MTQLSTFGGGEVSALVFDIGHKTTKVGYAGNDSPLLTNSTAAKTPQNNLSFDDNRLYKYHKDTTQLLNPFNPADNTVENWEVMEAIWDHAFTKTLQVDPKDQPLMYVEPAWNDSKTREKLLEMAFESFKVPAFYFGKSPVLSAFSAGRANALIIDSGATTTSVVPVYDAFCIKKAIQHQPFAGSFLSTQSLRYLQHEKKLTPTPQYKIKFKRSVIPDTPASFTPIPGSEHVDKTFHDFNMMRMMDDFKETICLTAESPFDERAVKPRSARLYEFPDGYNSSFGGFRYKVAEGLFNPAFVLKESETSPLPISIPQLVVNALQACDMDIRPLMFQNIVLTGGNTLMKGFADRLHYELNLLVPGMKVRIHAAGSTSERKYGAWIGGSILASLGSFHQLWISKEEYEESGVGIIDKR